MYRIETSVDLKTLVLLLFGTQDETEAKQMRIEMNHRLSEMDESWSLIFDLSEFEGTLNKAPKEQTRLAKIVGSTSLRRKFIIRSKDSELNSSLEKGASLTVAASFEQAWEHVGGLPRNITLAPPWKGANYPANNALPR